MLTAGLSLQALRQMLLSACYSGEKLQPEDVIEKVSEFIQAQLGEDVVEFKKTGAQSKRHCRQSKIGRFSEDAIDSAYHLNRSRCNSRNERLRSYWQRKNLYL